MNVKVSRPVSVSIPIFDGLGFGVEGYGLINICGKRKTFSNTDRLVHLGLPTQVQKITW